MSLKQGLFQICIWLLFLSSCQEKVNPEQSIHHEQYITILGIAQDAGYPQVACKKECCLLFHEGKEPKKHVSCIGLIDKITHKKWLFDATPDLTAQLDELKQNHINNQQIIDGVFLTHAHIGHYTGLMYLGREAFGGRQVPVYVMPRMKEFLRTNGPWSQLVDLDNITLEGLQKDRPVVLNPNLKVTPFLVPHRDEFSETVGYKIEGKNKSALFIPDINKWNLWEKDIVEEVKKVDYAFLDATFFQDGEILRPMNEVPHPFINETVTLFENESKETKSKVVFIHFNHSNPAILNSNKLKTKIENMGFKFAKEGDNYTL